ncbi:MAG TPA: S41 family peptidase [Cyclobacteriaceae bacterium]
MRKGIKIFIGIISISLIVAFAVPAEKYFDIAKSLDIFTTLFKEVNAFYVDEVDPKKLIDTGIQGMLQSLDPYTDYIPEEDIEAFGILTTGQYAGIGALIGIVNKIPVITNPYYGFPAHRAGLRVGDEFVTIDGTNVKGKSTSEISVLLKGKPKTELEVVVHRFGQKENLKFKLQREKIKISNVVYQGMIDGDIGYIKLDDFTPGAGKEVEDAVVSLKAKGAKKIMLDLRDNPGGLLYEAVNIVNAFIPKGLEVVSTKGKMQEWNKTYNTLNEPIDTEIPITVLTSSGSASASEIVAGSLQDYDRAILVGQKTFGKGLVQTTRSLSYNAQLKVTTAKYYIPSGRCIQALDYTHRKSDGTVERVADSMKNEFKTKHGRKVFDGGGLDPDVAIKSEQFATPVYELISSGLVFEYASHYCGEHPDAPASMRGFKLSDAEYQKFASWIKSQNFKYESDLEKKAEDLITAAKNERYYDELQSPLKELKNKIETSHNSDITHFKKEISAVLEQQIAFHYKLDAGEAEISLDRDEEILEAKKIFADGSKFKKLLSPN